MPKYVSNSFNKLITELENNTLELKNSIEKPIINNEKNLNTSQLTDTTHNKDKMQDSKQIKTYIDHQKKAASARHKITNDIRDNIVKPMWQSSKVKGVNTKRKAEYIYEKLNELCDENINQETIGNFAKKYGLQLENLITAIKYFSSDKHDKSDTIYGWCLDFDKKNKEFI